MTYSREELCRMLIDARQRTLDLISDLTDAQLLCTRLTIVNPLLWELGHVAWFQERWVLRHAAGRSPLRDDADSLFDSAAVAHDTRWDLPLPTRESILDYMQRVLDGVLERVDSQPLDEDTAYFPTLALFHEDMHGEAFVYTRQTLGYRPPTCAATPPHDCDEQEDGEWPIRDVEVPGGEMMLGSSPNSGFIFDNEKWAHRVTVHSFRIAHTPVTNAQFAQFVDDGGYSQRKHWSDQGWKWRQREGAQHPVYWRRGNEGSWFERCYDQVKPLRSNCPIAYVNWYEADAYARWAGRRLPTETEWERAATMTSQVAEPSRRFPWGHEPPTADRANLDLRYCCCVPVDQLPAGDSASGCRQLIGNVWEWTASDFLPYPGFSPDAYKEYSAPWFGTHKVLRGGAFATRSRLIRTAYRNFYTPDRRDVLAGFRTCAL